MRLLFIALFLEPITRTGGEIAKDVYEIKNCDIDAENAPLSFKDIDSRKGIATGYIANFNSLDSDGDIIKPGAFRKSLAETGPNATRPRIKYIFNHDYNQPLGKFLILQEDQKGLYYEAQLGTHALGVDFVKMVDSGLITEHSFGYRTLKYNQVTPWMDYRMGDVARELTELKVYEGSALSCWAANPNTPFMGIKGAIDPDKLNKRIDLFIKSLRSGTLTDDTFDLLEIELKQMQQLIIDLTKKPVVSTTSEPVTTTLKRSRSFAGLKELILQS